ncbi:cytochrome b [Frateuria aurantia]
MKSSHPLEYNSIAKAFHWSMALIIISAWCLGFYANFCMDFATQGPQKHAIVDLHKDIATLVLFLIVLRILWRLTHPAPALDASMSPRMKWLAHAGHLLLYLLMLAVPFSGWLYSSAAGYPSPVLGLFNLPPLVHSGARIQSVSHDLHLYLSLSFGAVLAGHVLMALKHHFIDKDDTLRMMTRRRRR